MHILTYCLTLFVVKILKNKKYVKIKLNFLHVYEGSHSAYGSIPRES